MPYSFLPSSFLTPLSCRYLSRLLICGDKCDRLETLTQYAECPQFTFQHCFGNLTHDQKITCSLRNLNAPPLSVIAMGSSHCKPPLTTLRLKSRRHFNFSYFILGRWTIYLPLSCVLLCLPFNQHFSSPRNGVLSKVYQRLEPRLNVNIHSVISPTFLIIFMEWQSEIWPRFSTQGCLRRAAKQDVGNPKRPTIGLERLAKRRMASSCSASQMPSFLICIKQIVVRN